MTEMTIPMEQRDIDLLAGVAADIGVSAEALARGAIIKMVEELSAQNCEPFETEEEAADFVTARFKEAVDEVW